MKKEVTDIVNFKVGTLKIEVHSSGEASGAAAAENVAEAFRKMSADNSALGVIFATGASQLTMLRALTFMHGIPWGRIRGFHLDEYVGLPVSHPASFRRYLREHLTHLVPMKAFHEIDGTAADPRLACEEYADKLHSSNPQLCLLGVGENGHLAFNDPGEADFEDPRDVKVVQLDPVCKRQQLEEGWFKNLQEVPERAITLTIPTILRVPRLIVSVPGQRKAQIVRRMLEDPISTACPATILRTHPDATVYLDPESAAELNGMLLSKRN